MGNYVTEHYLHTVVQLAADVVASANNWPDFIGFSVVITVFPISVAPVVDADVLRIVEVITHPGCGNALMGRCDGFLAESYDYC